MEYETIADAEAEVREQMKSRVAESIKQALGAETEVVRWQTLLHSENKKVQERAKLNLAEAESRAKSFQSIAEVLTKKFKPKKSDVDHWRSEWAKGRLANAEREHAHNNATRSLVEAALGATDIREQERNDLQAQLDNLDLAIAVADADHAYAKKTLAGQGTVKAKPKKGK